MAHTNEQASVEQRSAVHLSGSGGKDAAAPLTIARSNLHRAKRVCKLPQLGWRLGGNRSPLGLFLHAGEGKVERRCTVDRGHIS